MQFEHDADTARAANGSRLVGGPSSAARKIAGSGTRRRPRIDSGHLVLVVDDDPCIRLLVTRTMERLGHRVFAAENGAEAIALYFRHRHQVDLVITDMMMPVMDGPTLVSALVRIDPAIRILVSSGSNTDRDREKFTVHGITNFLPKPYMPAALASAVTELLAAPVRDGH